MLTDKDIQKIIEANRHVFATKEEFSDFREEMNKRFSALPEVFATKEEFSDFREEMNKRFSALPEVFATKTDLQESIDDLREEIRKSFSDLLTSVDAYAKKADTYFQEMLMLAHKVDRHEKWIKQIAENWASS